MKKEYWMKAEEIAVEMGVSKGHAYKLIRELNEELKQFGFVVIAGRVPRPYWEKISKDGSESDNGFVYACNYHLQSFK